MGEGRTSATGRTRRKKKRMRRILACVLAAMLVTSAVLVDRLAFPLRYVWSLAAMPEVAARAEGELRVHFLDVGQGDCTVIEFPDGKSMIVDGGDGDEECVRDILAYCFALGIETFDYILLTHTDSDHAGGLDEVVRCFGAETVFVPNGDGNENRAFASFMRQARKKCEKMYVSQSLQTIVSDSDEYFYYVMWLSPFSEEVAERETGGSSANENSAVLYLEYAGRRLLLPGDVSEVTEEKLIGDFRDTGGAVFEKEVETPQGTRTLLPDLCCLDFLKTGHHGSETSTGEVLAEYCVPQEVFISCGAGNAYGHPGLEVVRRVKQYSPEAQFYRTDETGNIILTIESGGSYAIVSQGGRSEETE